MEENGALYTWQLIASVGVIIFLIGAMFTALLHAFKKNKTFGLSVAGLGGLTTIISVVVVRFI